MRDLHCLLGLVFLLCQVAEVWTFCHYVRFQLYMLFWSSNCLHFSIFDKLIHIWKIWRLWCLRAKKCCRRVSTIINSIFICTGYSMTACGLKSFLRQQVVSWRWIPTRPMTLLANRRAPMSSCPDLNITQGTTHRFSSSSYCFFCLSECL